MTVDADQFRQLRRKLKKCWKRIRVDLRGREGLDNTDVRNNPISSDVIQLDRTQLGQKSRDVVRVVKTLDHAGLVFCPKTKSRLLDFAL